MTGIIVTVKEEFLRYSESLTEPKASRYAGMEFLAGKLHSREVVVVCCGGDIKTAICTQAMIDHFHIRGIIVTGLARPLDEHLVGGDIVVSNAIAHSGSAFTESEGASGGGDTAQNIVEADSRLIGMARQAYDDYESANEINARLTVGTVLSGFDLAFDFRRIERFRKEYNAIAVETGSIGAAYTCMLNEIPFIAIRTVSHTGGWTGKQEHRENVCMAADNSYLLVSAIMKLSSKSGSFRGREAFPELFC